MRAELSLSSDIYIPLLQGRQENLLKAKNKSFCIKTSVLIMEEFSTNWKGACRYRS